jgi:hypothetical protein
LVVYQVLKAFQEISGTTAVTEPPPANCDFKKRVIGGFG